MVLRSEFFISRKAEIDWDGCVFALFKAQGSYFSRDSLLEHIRKSAFSHSGLSFIFISERVEVVDRSPFDACSSLSEVTFHPNSRVTRFCVSSFRESGLEQICIPRSVKVLEANCFTKCRSLARVTFERDSQVVRVFEEAFWVTGVKHIDLPASLEYIHPSALEGIKTCSLAPENRFHTIDNSVLFSTQNVKSLI
jgi:hypothetical protein